MKKLLMLLLAAAMTLSLAGCSLEKPAVQQPQSGTQDNAAVVTIGGEVILTWAQYSAVFDANANYYMQGTGMNIAQDPDMLAEFQDLVIDYLTGSEIVAYQARQQGLDKLTDEQQAEIDADIQAEKQNLYDYYIEVAQGEAEADENIDVEARARELAAEEAVSLTGREMSYEEYEAWLGKRIENDYISNLLKEKVESGIEISASDIDAYYAEKSAAQQTAYGEDPASYEYDLEYFEMFGGEPILYAPEGFSRVLQIVAYPEGDLPVDYEEKIDTMSELEAEYGKLAFAYALKGGAPEGGDEALKLQEILTQYNSLKAETDAMYEAYMKEAREKVQAAYAELEGGASFLDVKKAFEGDLFDEASAQGMLITAKHETETWSSAVMEAFKSLAMGAYSPVFEDEDGLHILYYLSDEEQGLRPIDGMREAIKTSLLEAKKATEWEEHVALWKKDASVVIDEALVRQAGVALG